MAETKVTKMGWFEMIKGCVAAAELDEETRAGMMEFIDTQMGQLQHKAELAAKRAAEKRAEGDALRAQIQDVLTGEFATIDQVTAQVMAEGVTKAKVTARLTQLVKSGVAVKDTVKLEDSRKVAAYKLA